MVEKNEEDQELEGAIEQLKDALERLVDEDDNEELLEWIMDTCAPEWGIIDGLVANFIDNYKDVEVAQSRMKILK